MKQLAVDLVILNERPAAYIQDLQTALETMARANRSRSALADEEVRGTVFVVRADLLSVEARIALQAVARAVLLSRRGSLAEQVKRVREPKPVITPRSRPSSTRREMSTVPAKLDLEFFNGPAVSPQMAGNM